MSGGGDQTTKVEGWGPAQKALKEDVVPHMRAYAQDYGQNPNMGLWNWNRLAPQSPQTKGAEDWQLAYIPEMTKHMDQNVNTFQGFLKGEESAANVARRDAFSDQAWENFGGARQNIEERGTFAGQYGGPQSALAVGTAAGQTMRDINSLEAQMMEKDRERQFEATQIAPSLFMSRLLPSQIRADVGARRDARGQLEHMDKIQQFEANRRNRLQTLFEGQQLFAPLTGTASATTAQGGSNDWQAALGTGLMAYGAGANPYMAGAIGIGSMFL
jgi:hypothetical protein